MVRRKSKDKNANGLGISLDPDAAELLGDQLYRELRRLILAGQLAPGARLPPSRALAEMIEVSRSTVTETYDQLLTEGYLVSRGRHGTFVSPAIPKTKSAKPQSKRRTEQDVSQLSDYGRNIASGDGFRRENNVAEICFYGWQPAFDQFPHQQWARTIGRFARGTERSMMDYSTDPLGSKELRQAISGYLARVRGIKCAAEQILVVNGFQQALDLILRLHISTGDSVIVENPGYPWARLSVTASGGKILSIPVDNEGMQVEQLNSRSAQHAKLLCLTPSHQFPTGAVLPLPRRLKLLDWAQKTSTLIVEDEHDSEYRYDGRVIPALKSLDTQDQVIYIGTFAKVLFPAIATGYLVLPVRLVEMYARARLLTGEQLPNLIQLPLAEFIQEGLLERHIGRMLDLYTSRRQALLRALNKYIGKRVQMFGADAGMHIMVRLETALSSEEIVSRAAAKGVGLIDTASYYVGRAQAREFILGYGALDEPTIREGIRRLAKIIKR